ncbi:ATP phosphoribosyltransferase regulatory subunit [Pistricoccus aurantiacus]|uniref:ATP phosphoribosyltransferase regulatory subunit n=1 Tax=Pistricoccus aurantiacus TaxID=1883414 RepID=UPI00364533A6
MTTADRWLLPDGMDEVLPPQATRMEELRRTLLNLYDCWGYDQVMPPAAEFLDSLLTGTGSDLALQTFKIVDQLSGRTLGVSADVTPQVARMDAHSLRRPGPARLCYCTTVLRAQADQYQGGRSPVQVGVELFGHADIQADLEVLRLALASLRVAGAGEVHLALGHIGLYRSLVEAADLDVQAERGIFSALALKSPGELQVQLETHVRDPDLANMLASLVELHGGDEIFETAREVFSKAPKPVITALDQLETLCRGIQAAYPKVELYFDLAELRGYRYHTGMVFSAYVPGYGQALVKGGRYDNTGQAFGRARPATGFSMDLKLLVSLAEQAPPLDGIWAPAEDTPGAETSSLARAIETLRRSGERVVQALPGQQDDPETYRCNRRLVRMGDDWQVSPLK